MSSRFPNRFLALVAAAAIGAAPPAVASDSVSAPERELRVCADPDNLPYSHVSETGFENRIAALVAAEMRATLVYAWLPQIRGYVRKTLGAGLCELFIGVPTDFERLLTTRPYYRSGYAFVSAATPPQSFDDPRLGRLRIGVQLPGDDLAATPPGHVLAQRGWTRNVRGFTVMGEGPAAERLIRSIDRGELDLGLVWGPQAGYFAARSARGLRVSLAPAPDGAEHLPFEFSISMGVRRGNHALRDELESIIARRQPDIDAILDEYRVPRIPLPAKVAGGASR